MRVEVGTPVPHPRVFLEKRLQTIENKGNECGKECKETTKRPQALERDGFATAEQSAQRKPWSFGFLTPHPRGFCMDVKKKGLREKGFVRV